MLRAPADGDLIGYAEIGDHLEESDLIAEVQTSNIDNKLKIENRKSKIVSPFKGVLRGLIHPGLQVTPGLKIGDVDPRDERSACFLVSDKALAVGGGVLEAILSKEEVCKELWG